jgi:hypothetical protein
MPAAPPTSPQPAGEFACLPTRTAGYGLLALVLLASFLSVTRKDWTELPLYLRAAARLQQGEPLYRHTERPWTYPALFALPFVPMLALPPAVRAPLWHALNGAIVLFLVWRLERRVRPLVQGSAGTSRRAPAWLFWALVWLLAGRHVLSPLENQSHDLVVLLSVVLANEARCTGADLAAGWWAGLGAALKATPLLFLPVFLWQRRFRAAAVMAGVLPALLLLPDALCPAKDGVSWTVAWHREFLTPIKPGEVAVSSAWDPWCQLNQSLAGTFQRLLVPLPPTGRDPKLNQVDVRVLSVSPPVLRGLTLAGQLAVFLWLLWLTRPGALAGLSPQRASWLRFGQGAALVVAMVLMSPTSIKTHFCVLLLPVVFCLGDYLYQRRDRVVGAALLATFVLSTLTVKDLLGKDLGDRVMASGSVTWCALALLLATGHVLLRRARQWRRQERAEAQRPAVPKAASRPCPSPGPTSRAPRPTPARRPGREAVGSSRRATCSEVSAATPSAP